jgi:hypothetical protein
MQWGRLLRAALLSGYLLTKGFYRLPHRRHAPFYALFFALWCAPLGTLLSALWTAGQMGALHVIFLGSFGLATTVIASCVISAHCDAEEEWSGGGSRLGLVFLLLVLALLLRLGAEVLPLYYFAFLQASALLWMGGKGCGRCDLYRCLDAWNKGSTGIRQRRSRRSGSDPCGNRGRRRRWRGSHRRVGRKYCASGRPSGVGRGE